MFTVREKLKNLLSRRIIRYVRIFDYITHELIEEGRVGSLNDDALNKVYLSYQVRFARGGHWFNVDFWV